jgi:hypothetical protein
MLSPMTMKGMTWIFRNFQGLEGKYNKPGVRNFGIKLDDDIAEEMLADEWNVKYLKPRPEDLEENPNLKPQAWLPIEAAWDKGRPPNIFVITSQGRVKYDEEDVPALDWVDVMVDQETNLPMLDLIVNPYRWKQPNGDTGVKAYLKSMYVTIVEDELEQKYAHIPLQQ